jgi:hypothetical protein
MSSASSLPSLSLTAIIMSPSSSSSSSSCVKFYIFARNCRSLILK